MSVESRRGGAQRGHERPREQRRAPIDKLTGLLRPVVAESGFDLEEINVTPAGRRRLVRVVVDGDQGVSLDDIAVVSRAVSDALDRTELMGAAPYVLEVTSPGVDRPLTEPRHWRRAAGRLVRVTAGPEEEIEGRVITADDETVLFDIDGRERRLELAALGRGRVQVEFHRPGGTTGTTGTAEVEGVDVGGDKTDLANADLADAAMAGDSGTDED